MCVHGTPREASLLVKRVLWTSVLLLIRWFRVRSLAPHLEFPVPGRDQVPAIVACKARPGLHLAPGRPRAGQDVADITPDQRERQCRFDEEIISCESRLGPFEIKREHHADAMTLLPPLPRDALSDIRWRARETGSAPWLRCAGLEASLCAARPFGCMRESRSWHGYYGSQCSCPEAGADRGADQHPGGTAERVCAAQAHATGLHYVRGRNSRRDEHAASGVLG